MTKLILDDITLNPDENEDTLSALVREKLGTAPAGICIVKKSLDARKKTAIVYRYRLVVTVPDEEAARLIETLDLQEYHETAFPDPVYRPRKETVIIAGTGPAGLFAALRLLEGGFPVILLERGKMVEERMRDIDRLETQGILDPDSNVLFGEGGAGTYSDGKLTARSPKPGTDWFYRKLVEHGAPPSIMYEQRPHLGSDVLRNIIVSLRHTIEGKGGTFRFGETLQDIIIRDGKLSAVVTSRDRIVTNRLILATGHSARDIYPLLKNRGITLQAKGFAVGIRVEHPADLIRSIQYGTSPHRDILPAPDYHLTHRCRSGRGVYSFCMCPGGRVINSSSEPAMLCTNGMSLSGRDLPHSNAAIVVTVSPEDFSSDPLQGIEFQRRIESGAFSVGGGGFIAPAQSVPAFLAGKREGKLPPTSYLPGVIPAGLHELFPPHMVSDLREGLRRFGQVLPGFASDQGILIGVETRTSSPVRILRNEALQSPDAAGLYPAGEGAGYAGGIVSSAVDGIRIADSILAEL